MKISDIAKNSNAEWFYASAIVAIAKKVVQTLNKEGLIGVYVAVNPAQISPYGEDLRPDDQKILTLVISTATLKNVRTISVGERFKGKPVNHSAYKRILENSPVKHVQGQQTKAAYLLKKKEINDYIYRLNRYPFRSVDVQLNAAEEGGLVDLDYLVYDDKPWQVYANTSNTGPRHTSPWFERFGFVDYQLTNNDDTLSIEYATTGFNKIHTALGTYEAPAGHVENLRWRVYGLYNHFTASEFALLSALFTGQQWIGGADLIITALQRRDLFFDLIVGARWANVFVNNHLAGVTGDSNFFLPRIGIGIERRRIDSTIYIMVYGEGNIANVADTTVSELIRLGRITNDKNWQLLNWTIFLSTFLEPWSANHCPSKGHLAHELAWSLNGQFAFNYRLIPQMQRIAGGLHSVGLSAIDRCWR